MAPPPDAPNGVHTELSTMQPVSRLRCSCLPVSLASLTPHVHRATLQKLSAHGAASALTLTPQVAVQCKELL